MTAEVFLDSNILLYACSAAPADVEKQVIANSLILETDFALSTQVLQEFIANALRKKILGISENKIDVTMELAGHVPVLPITHELVLSAIILRRPGTSPHPLHRRPQPRPGLRRRKSDQSLSMIANQ